MMSLTINSALPNSQYSLNVSHGAASTSLQRLSAGLKINSAKDDATGLALPESIGSQIKGQSQAMRNANDGITLTQTAKEGLGKVNDILQRMGQLATWTATGAISSENSDTQQEVSDLIKDLNDVANSTKLNDKNLLDGTLGAYQFKVGANSDQTITVAVSSVKTSDIGNQVFASNIPTAIQGTAADTFAGNGFAAQTLSITSSNSNELSFAAGTSANAIVIALSEVSSLTGITATASTTATISGLSHNGAISFELYGANTRAVTISATISDTSDLSAVAQAINAENYSTNITAVADKRGNLVLSETLGNDIGIKNRGAVDEGLDGASFRGADTKTANGKVSSGVAVTLGAVGSTTNSAQVGGQVVFSAANSFSVSTDKDGTFAAAGSNVSTFHPLSEIDLSTRAGANAAISTIDAASTSINNNVASLGAVENRFASIISNLQSTSARINDIRNSITDTDFALEALDRANGQILQQAGKALLAQANSLPDGVLALLRG